MPRGVRAGWRCQVVSTMANLANMIGPQGQHDEARKLLKKVLKIHRRTYGEGHQEVATASFNILSAETITPRSITS